MMTKVDLMTMYSTDKEFLDNYHGNIGWSLEQCVDDSWNNIKDLELHVYDFGYIAVNRNDVIDRLAGFFITPEFRTQKVRFFNEVNKLLEGAFIATLHSSNKKAIKFLATRGQITKSDNITTYIVFRKGDLICLG